MATSSFPEGKFLAMVKVGPKGQIVIPSEVRELFGIQPGDSLLLLADRDHGIALPNPVQTQDILKSVTEYMKGSMG